MPCSEDRVPWSDETRGSTTAEPSCVSAGVPRLRRVRVHGRTVSLLRRHRRVSGRGCRFRVTTAGAGSRRPVDRLRIGRIGFVLLL